VERSVSSLFVWVDTDDQCYYFELTLLVSWADTEISPYAELMVKEKSAIEVAHLVSDGALSYLPIS
jgi:hypothetical protein